jgi:cyclopropane fatty-acyl-phospholipid synthase-like methyltransferase
MTPLLELSDEEVAILVSRGYDAIAQRYASYAVAATSHPRHAWVDRLLGQMLPRSQVLELGCGPGVPTAAAIVAAGHGLVGVDISAGQLAIAQNLVPSATFVHANFLDLDFEPGAFDAIVALYSIIHVPRRHYPALFARLRRWLTPGGWLLATFGTGDSPGWLEENLFGFGATNWTNSFDRPTTERLLYDAGLSVEAVDLVEQDEPTGLERWLYVLARPAGSVGGGSGQE